MKLLFTVPILLVAFSAIVLAQWQPSSDGVSPQWSMQQRSVYSFFEKDSLLFAGTDQGVYRSTDQGHTWRGQTNYVDRWTKPPMAHVKDFLVMQHRYYMSTPKWQWVDQLFSPTDSIDRGAIATDPHGNAIVATMVEGKCIFDEEDSLNISPAGMLVMKVDSNGKILWKQTALTPNYGITVTAVACDSSGNSFILGAADPWIFHQIRTVDFGTTQISTNTTGRTFFVASYDPAGSFRWAKMATVDTIADAYGIAADAAGNVYFTGTMMGHLDMGGPFNVYNRRDWAALFVGKMSPTGSMKWLKQSSSKNHFAQYQTNRGEAYGLCVDPPGNCYVVGSTNDTEFVADHMIAGDYLSFIARYNTNGSGDWVVTIIDHGAGSAYHDGSITSITCDKLGNPTFLYAPDRDDVTINDTQYWAGDGGGVYAAMDSSGGFRWVKTGPRPSSDAISSDPTGNLYGTCNFGTPLVFGKDTLFNKYTRHLAAVFKIRSNGTPEEVTFDAATDIIAPCRDGSLYGITGVYDISKNQRFGRLGYGGTLGISRLSASAPGWTTDTDLVIGADNGAYWSVNNGRSWNEGLPANWRSSYSANQLALIDTTLFAAGGYTNNIIFKSTNFGEVWDTVITPATYGYVRAIGNRLYANGTAHSDDLGNTWTQDQCKTADGYNLNIGQRWFEQGGAMALDNSHEWFSANVGFGGYTQRWPLNALDSKALAYFDNLLFDGSTALNISDNLGETWHPIDDGLTRYGSYLGYRVLCFHRLGDEVLIGTDSGGVFRRPLSDIHSKIFDVVPTFSWAAQGHALGDAASDAVVIDQSGNAIVLGHFAGALQLGNYSFDHRQGTPRTGVDYFLAKYDGTGNIAWALQLQGGGVADTSYPLSLSVSRAGAIYVSGYFTSTLSAGGTTLRDRYSVKQTFLMKCNPDGTIAWLDTVTPPATSTRIYQIAADSNNDVVLVGTSVGSMSIKGITLPGLPFYPRSFVALIGADGVAKWANRIAPIAPYASAAYAVAVTPDNHYIVGGGASDSGLFLVTLDNSGQMLDSTRTGKSYTDFVSSINVDGNGNAYVQVMIADSAALGSTKLKGNSSRRFLAKHNSDGWQWARMIGNQRVNSRFGAPPLPCRTSTTPDGLTYVIGLDSTTGQSPLERSHGTNHVSKLDANGQWIWTKQLASNYSCDVYAIAAGNDGAVWTAGAIYTDRNAIQYSCIDMAFGLIPLGPTSLDSSTRPFIANLGTSSVIPPLTVTHPDRTNTVDFVRVYPNPTSGPLTVVLNSAKAGRVNITLFDQLARTIKEQFGETREDGSLIFQFPAGTPAGSYLLRVASDDEVQMVPVAIN
ncbi:MAG: hypothetical protein Q8922_08795 [Bacteroidota bacterium]|nr:hypothetical protein [Bacteroidota bacterium]MDP4234402.1 hypothetical protein [Bacteroidota bacterium]MDP4243334.1 hypothetical protein [Bacteroidota bacterium]MDP4288020.1 hypothetical protein [Bacteroidota bacterium]